MRVLLVDADSVIPNIVLGKLSTYHKALGDEVRLTRLNLPYYPNRKKTHYYLGNHHDRVYCSVIFEGNFEYIHGKNIIFGGTGYDLETELNDELENTEIDYGIYPQNDTSYGFISRGCIRNCSFCKVPQKEGKIRQVNPVDKIVRHKTVKFLDNNILALPNHYDILSELSEKQIKCCFNQGLDIRLVDQENSQLLSELNYLGEYVFALDNEKYIKFVDHKIKTHLTWARDWQFKFFVYAHPDMAIASVVNRIEYLKKIKHLPYIMRDISCWGSKHQDFYTDICAWANQVHIFKKMDFGQFMIGRYPNKSSRPRIRRNTELYYDNMRLEC